MTTNQLSDSTPTPTPSSTPPLPAGSPPSRAPDAATMRANRWTVSGGVALLTICALHTLVFAAHPYWADWLAGPTRGGPLSTEPMLLFWALPGGLAVPGAMLGLLLIGLGRRGESVALWLPITLLAWAGLCVWITGGPTGFMMLTVPAVLLIIGRLRRAADRLS